MPGSAPPQRGIIQPLTLILWAWIACRTLLGLALTADGALGCRAGSGVAGACSHANILPALPGQTNNQPLTMQFCFLACLTPPAMPNWIGRRRAGPDLGGLGLGVPAGLALMVIGRRGPLRSGLGWAVSNGF